MRLRCANQLHRRIRSSDKGGIRAAGTAGAAAIWRAVRDNDHSLPGNRSRCAGPRDRGRGRSYSRVDMTAATRRHRRDWRLCIGIARGIACVDICDGGFQSAVIGCAVGGAVD